MRGDSGRARRVPEGPPSVFGKSLLSLFPVRLTVSVLMYNLAIVT